MLMNWLSTTYSIFKGKLSSYYECEFLFRTNCIQSDLKQIEPIV